MTGAQGAGLDRVHETSVRILAEVGVRLLHPEVLEAVRRRGVAVDGDVARFREDQVLGWVARAPRSFRLGARNPARGLTLGGGPPAFAPGYGCPAVVEADGRRRGATLGDYVRFARLTQATDLLQVNGGILVEPGDLPGALSRPLLLYAAASLSDKCLLGFPGRTEEIRRVMDLAAILAGGPDELAREPRLLTLVNSTSPLQFDRIALDTMGCCAERGQPVIVSPGPMAGATGPVSLAGNLALGNAEALAGIAVLQMLREGTPCLYGLQATTADLKTGGVSIGSPGFALQAAWGARLARRYGLPCRGGGASTDAKALSPQSGYEAMLALYASCAAGLDLVLHGAGILDSYAAMSFEQFAVDLEMLGMLRYYFAGVRVDEGSLAFEAIRSVGPGGQFLTSPHTLKRCRAEPWVPTLGRGPRGGEQGEAIRARLDRLLEQSAAPPLDPGTRAELRSYLGRLGAGAELLDRCEAA